MIGNRKEAKSIENPFGEVVESLTEGIYDPK